MRVIAGRLRGRAIRVPRRGVRPTYDRVRESLFAVVGSRMRGANVLDLFAGSGSLGIESLSRGASAATFVERAPEALSVLRANVLELGLGRASTLRKADALAYVRRPAPSRRFDVVFVDPPYASGLCERALALLGDWEGLAPGGLVVAEHEARKELEESFGLLRRVRTMRYGGIGVDLYEASCGRLDGREDT